MRFKRLLSALLALSPLAVQAQKQYLLTSPDSRIEARVSIDKQLSYNVSVRLHPEVAAAVTVEVVPA